MARLEDSHAVIQVGTAQPPAPDLPKWNPGLGLPDRRPRENNGGLLGRQRFSAEKAEVKPGMTVVSINGVPAGLGHRSVDELAQEILRRYSSERALQIRRGSATAFDSRSEEPWYRSPWRTLKGRERRSRPLLFSRFAILPRLPVPRRGIGDSAALSWVMLENQIGYIYVRRVLQGLEAGLDRAITDMAGMKGLIIDVRGNSGGGFETSTAFQNFDLASRSSADSKRPLYRGPIALLIDERTISAGEGWASWFIANKRARVFGTTTAGASSRKETYTLSNGLYKVVVPVKAYAGFLDRPIERLGLQPDVEVRCTAKDLAGNGRDTGCQKPRPSGW